MLRLKPQQRVDLEDISCQLKALIIPTFVFHSHPNSWERNFWMGMKNTFPIFGNRNWRLLFPSPLFKGLLEKLGKLECTLNRFAKYVGSHVTAFQKKDEWVQKAAKKNKFT